MPDAAPAESPGPGSGPRLAAASARRRLEAAMAGHRGDQRAARAALSDPEPSVRAAALGALARLGSLRVDELLKALEDPSPVVRRRAAQESLAAGPPGRSPGRPSPAVLEALCRRAGGDDEALVVEMACWALGEAGQAEAVPVLEQVAGDHPDSRCREAAVAALGALGGEGITGGLSAVLGALDDRPPVRRRAVVALAAFEGPAVEAALARALEDRDWQVRQAAEILLES